MIRFEALLGIAVLVIWLYAVFDSITAPTEQIRVLPKGIWVLIVLLAFPPAGAALWYAFGRPRQVVAAGQVPGGLGDSTRYYRRARGGPGTSFGRGAARDIAPDDDIAFLQSLDAQLGLSGMDKNRPEPDSSADDTDGGNPSGTTPS